MHCNACKGRPAPDLSSKYQAWAVCAGTGPQRSKTLVSACSALPKFEVPIAAYQRLLLVLYGTTYVRYFTYSDQNCHSQIKLK